MAEFLTAVRDYSFMQHALAAGLLSSIACGIIGSYVVTRRISYIAGGIAHSVLGGMGLAHYLSVVHEISWLTPLGGAAAAAVVAALIIGLVSIHARQREDTVIGAIWAVGMAVGVLFMARTPGYSQDLMSYLFGNILMVSKHDLIMIAVLDVAVVAAGVLWYKQMLAICFDEEFAALRGLHVRFFYLMLLVLTALTVVLLVTVVGIIMVIALLTLPAAIAGHFTKTLWQMMMLSTLCCAIFTTGGLALSYTPDLPAGATIIILAGAAYLLVAALSALPRLKRRRQRPQDPPAQLELF